MSNDTITTGKVAGIHYVLRSDEGEVLDQSAEDQPMHYLHGKNNIVAGLEKALAGKAVGDHVSVKVPPEEGYGRKQGKSQKMRRSEFPDDAVIEKGARFVVRTREGRAIPIWITKIMGPTITVDHNHPLAGETLHFEVDVKSIRDATDDELKHGHAHGPDGHAGHGDGDGDGDE
jgi:FKBP-type peptidyl-prolyl cis-trans isomerase SlyD